MVVAVVAVPDTSPAGFGSLIGQTIARLILKIHWVRLCIQGLTDMIGEAWHRRLLQEVVSIGVMYAGMVVPADEIAETLVYLASYQMKLVGMAASDQV